MKHEVLIAIAREEKKKGTIQNSLHRQGVIKLL